MYEVHTSPSTNVHQFNYENILLIFGNKKVSIFNNILFYSLKPCNTSKLLFVLLSFFIFVVPIFANDFYSKYKSNL